MIDNVTYNLASILELGECGALWGKRERVVWSICVVEAAKYSFQIPPKLVNVCTGNEII